MDSNGVFNFTMYGVPMCTDLKQDTKRVHIHPFILGDLLDVFTQPQINEIFKLEEPSE